MHFLENIIGKNLYLVWERVINQHSTGIVYQTNNNQHNVKIQCEHKMNTWIYANQDSQK